jgi:peptidoglycan-associated lipoprotein
VDSNSPFKDEAIIMRRGFLGRQRTVGVLAAVSLAAMACSTTNSNEAQEAAEPGRGLAQVAAPSTTADPDLRAVYFETDSAVLREEGRASLHRDAQQIQSNPDWGVVTVEGHCDERGNEEYNLALGERRAAAVKQYLSDLGVSADRLETRSYGELEPAAPGHDEMAWRLNRRAQLEIGD